MKGKAHIPICQFGFIELEIKEEDSLETILTNFDEVMVSWKAMHAPKNSEPKVLGETMTENGHTYKAVMNEREKKLYWLIETI